MSPDTLTVRSDQSYWERRYAEGWDGLFHGMAYETREAMAREEKRFAAELAAILQPAHLVLDAGCGYGRLTPLIAPHVLAYIGVDFARAAIDEARKGAPANAYFYVSDIRDFEHEPFDVIVAVGLERTPELLDHLRSLLKPDGVIYP